MNGLREVFTDPFPDGFAAVADLDLDGLPEIVRTSYTQGDSRIVIVEWDMVNQWHVDTTIALPDTLARTLGGPPTIADFDNTPGVDGKNYLEFGVAGSEFYQVYKVDQVVVGNAATFESEITPGFQWDTPLSNSDASSSSTGSSVFDFEGDGIVEVVYADQNELFILDGPSGQNRIMSTTNFMANQHCSGTIHE